MNKITFSTLPKTWLFDLDGTIVKHNGHLEGEDILLDGVKELFEKIDEKDRVIFLTSRKVQYKKDLEKFLKKNNIKVDLIIYDLPFGERILINDCKPSGLKTAYALNKKRDDKLIFNFETDEDL